MRAGPRQPGVSSRSHPAASIARDRTATRRRRSAAETRDAILEAAERRLVDGGPEAIRLQEIAADAGISHPAILHHFGSREGLVEAMVAARNRKASGAIPRGMAECERTRHRGSARALLRCRFAPWNCADARVADSFRAEPRNDDAGRVQACGRKNACRAGFVERLAKGDGRRSSRRRYSPRPIFLFSCSVIPCSDRAFGDR